MAESEFQTELGRGFDAVTEPIHYHKLRDMPNYLARQSRVVFKNPYDCFLLFGGVYTAMELKQRKGLSLRTLAPDSGQGLTVEQEEALLAVGAAGGRAAVVCNFRSRLSAREAKRRGCEAINLAFVCSIGLIARERERRCTDTFPLAWFEEYASALTRQTKASGASWNPLPILRGEYF